MLICRVPLVEWQPLVLAHETPLARVAAACPHACTLVTHRELQGTIPSPTTPAGPSSQKGWGPLPNFTNNLIFNYVQNNDTETRKRSPSTLHNCAVSNPSEHISQRETSFKVPTQILIMHVRAALTCIITWMK